MTGQEGHVAMMDFSGQVVVVTGAGRGLGRRYALDIAARGGAVVVNDRGTSLAGNGVDHAPADGVVEEIRQAGGQAVPSYASVTDPNEAASAVSLALSEFGRLDAVINNAGIMRMPQFAELSLDGLSAHLEVHVMGSVNICRAAWPHFTKVGYGRIVNTVSGAIFGLSGGCEYGPAKGAVFAFTRSLAVEAASKGIKVNAIAPQGMTRMLTESGLDDDVKARLSEQMRPELVAPGALYLAHPDCTLNGETLEVSGGRVGRITLSANAGIVDPLLTPEMIRDRLDEVMDETTLAAWSSADERYRRRAYGQKAGPGSREQ
jgi:NAD(P)-dependent dehydrogenase (short-subunit alcohol dehydrogenase family)